MTQIKICGLTRIQDIEAVNRWKPDYIGFVFAKSKRQITANQARYLKENLHPNIKAVGVFVNEKIDSLVQMVNTDIIHMVQLHGDETEEYIKELKHHISCPIIKAISVQSRESILSGEELSSEYLLLDSYQKGQYGGSGITFNHSLIPEIKKPYFLAGGLNRDNICNVIKTYHPYGVDISSGVETEGVKDEYKIREIIEMIRDATC